MHVCGLFLSVSIPFSKAMAVTLEGWQSLHLLSERRGRHAGTGGANNRHMFYKHVCIYDYVIGRSKSQGVECHFMQQDGLYCIVCWPWLDHSSHSSSWSPARLLSLHAVVKKPYGCIFAHASHTLINLGRDMMRHVLFHRFHTHAWLQLPQLTLGHCVVTYWYLVIEPLAATVQVMNANLVKDDSLAHRWGA